MLIMYQFSDLPSVVWDCFEDPEYGPGPTHFGEFSEKCLEGGYPSVIRDYFFPMDYETYGKRVIDLVVSWIGNHKKFRGVCVDTIRSEYEYGVSVFRAAETAEMETMYHDFWPW